VILNGIAPSLGGLDLLSRTIQIRTLPIPEGKRVTENEFYGRFQTVLPAVFGALLTAVSGALRMKDFTPRYLPRMADAAAFVMRAEAGGGLPWKAGTFAQVFTAKERSKENEALQSDPIASKILELAETGWKGTMKDLLAEISRDLTTEEKRHLPLNPRGLSPKLVELAPFLRNRGVSCERSGTVYLGHHMVSITKIPQNAESAFSFLDEK
jgi:hypothetical protein